MAGTTFYFHDATTSDTGTLPSTSQSSLGTPGSTADATSVNRSMDTNIGTAQTSKAITNAATSGTKKDYFTRFCSSPLAAQTIATDTWTLTFAAKTSVSANPGFFSTTWTQPVLYVWRPSTGALVGKIIDAAGSGFEGSVSAGSERVSTGSFSGSAVTCSAGDILCFEVYLSASQSSSATTWTFYYDGTAVSSSNGQVVSTQASNINTPSNTITFGGATTPIFLDWCPITMLVSPGF